MGVERALARAGARDGVVRIGGIELTYEKRRCEPSLAVVKIGSSSITRPSGELDDAALVKLAEDLARARDEGHRIVLVMSGAIAAGMPALGLTKRPRDIATLQAISPRLGQPGCSNA